jgi:hypothetical protein
MFKKLLSILFVVLLLASVSSLNVTYIRDVNINHQLFINESFTLSSDDYEVLQSVKGATEFVNSHFAKTGIKNGTTLRAIKPGQFEDHNISLNNTVKLDIVAPATAPVNLFLGSIHSINKKFVGGSSTHIKNQCLSGLAVDGNGDITELYRVFSSDYIYPDDNYQFPAAIVAYPSTTKKLIFKYSAVTQTPQSHALGV